LKSQSGTGRNVDEVQAQHNHDAAHRGRAAQTENVDVPRSHRRPVRRTQQPGTQGPRRPRFPSSIHNVNERGTEPEGRGAERPNRGAIRPKSGNPSWICLREPQRRENRPFVAVRPVASPRRSDIDRPPLPVNSPFAKFLVHAGPPRREGTERTGPPGIPERPVPFGLRRSRSDTKQTVRSAASLRDADIGGSPCPVNSLLEASCRSGGSSLRE
jgi:hypothetical protein